MEMEATMDLMKQKLLNIWVSMTLCHMNMIHFPGHLS